MLEMQFRSLSTLPILGDQYGDELEAGRIGARIPECQCPRWDRLLTPIQRRIEDRQPDSAFEVAPETEFQLRSVEWRCRQLAADPTE